MLSNQRSSEFEILSLAFCKIVRAFVKVACDISKLAAAIQRIEHFLSSGTCKAVSKLFLTTSFSVSNSDLMIQNLKLAGNLSTHFCINY